MCGRLTLLLILSSLCAAVFPAPLKAADKKPDLFILDELARGLDVVWGIAFLSPDEIIFTEKAGVISLLHLSDGSISRLSGTPAVKAAGQGGMLDVAVPQNYNDKHWIYFTYVKPVDSYGATTLARAKLAANSLTDWQDLLTTRSATSTSRHFGSRIAFDRQGHVYFSIGDRGERPSAQDLASHSGSVLRLNLDGSIPDDNPFIHTQGARAEIYSYGHRNPQGLAYDAVRDRLWLIEHGPRGGDEINLVKAGANYGWPVVSYGKEYYAPIPVGEAVEKPGIESPVKVYIPSIAPGSLLLYSGDAFPAWKGKLLAGALKLRHINIISLDDKGNAVSEERILESLNERIRALVEGPDGNLYFSTDSGKIFRLRST